VYTPIRTIAGNATIIGPMIVRFGMTVSNILGLGKPAGRGSDKTHRFRSL
jgi:hypothetical protein